MTDELGNKYVIDLTDQSTPLIFMLKTYSYSRKFKVNYKRNSVLRCYVVYALKSTRLDKRREKTGCLGLVNILALWLVSLQNFEGKISCAHSY
jgi:hypothetical protein